MVRPSARTASGSPSRPARMIVVKTTRTRAVRSSAARSDDSDCSESRMSMRRSNDRWRRATESRWVEVDRQALEETVWRHRQAHVKR